MRLTSIELKNYRNLEQLSILPCEEVNIIYGDNAQGKTNLIEAIWLFTGNSSFRYAKLNELIQFHQKQSMLSVHFEDREREQHAKLILSSKKEIYLNQVPFKKASDLAGHFYCVVFSPADLDLIKGNPKGRRRFLDLAISQLTPQYLKYLETYDRILDQRNALLKEIPRNLYLKDTLDIWDQQLAKVGTIISIYRSDYVRKLAKISQNIYSGLSNQKETFEVFYRCSAFDNSSQLSVYDDPHIQFYYQKLKQNLEQDIRCGFTSVGIHRDDLDFLLDGVLLKTYGSQGQQRSGVIALKLSEASLLKRVTGENPIVLLDDVMSELDVSRQNYILNHVKNQQVFITCCDVFNTVHLKKGKIFKISQGALVEEKNVMDQISDEKQGE